MKHNRNIDNFRALALLQILVYHAYAVSGSSPPGFVTGLSSKFLQLSGEIGVTAFFALSGFGMYNSIAFACTNKTFNYRGYLIKRAKRILPPYYFCLAVSILLFSGNYVSVNGIKHIAAHLLLVHNLFPSCHGSINGALWTVGTIAQFYLIAPLLYKLFEKNGYLAFLATLAVTVLAKASVYQVLYSNMEEPGWYAFYAGRQLITALDNFTVGMFAAWFVEKYASLLKSWAAGFLTVAAFAAQLFLCSFGLSHGIHTNNISGYVWHSLTALTIGFLMIGLAYFPQSNRSGDAVLQFLAKKEYIIYLWHLPVYENMLQRSEFVMLHSSDWLGILLLVMAAVLMGVIMSNVSFEFFPFHRRTQSQKIIS